MNNILISHAGTLVFGNCGVGFAPCAKDQREFITQLSKCSVRTFSK